MGFPSIGRDLATLLSAGAYMASRKSNNETVVMSNPTASASKKHIEAGPGGQIEIYHELKPRKPPIGSRYDKLNCPHGSFVDRDYSQFKSTSGRKSIGVIGFGKSDNNYLNALRQSPFFLPIANATNNGNTGEDNRLINVVWAKRTYWISNANLQGCEVEINHCICKKSTASTPYVAMAEDVQRHGDPALTAYDTFFTATELSTSETEISLSLDKMPYFRDLYGVTGRKTCYLKPGETVKLTTFYRMNHMVGGEINEQQDTLFEKGVAHGIILLSHGRLGHTTAAVPAFTGVHLDTAVEYTYYLRQQLPLRDYFYKELGNWNNEGGALATVEVIEESDPVTETGV